MAFQQGLLPLDLEAIEWAVKHTWGPALDMNMRALHLGRKLVVAPEEVLPADQVLSADQIIERRIEVFRKQGGISRRKAQKYASLAREACETLMVSEEAKRYFALGICDLIQYDSATYAGQYVDLVLQVHAHDSAGRGYVATESAIRNLHRVMLIKDEVYVAHLLTNEEKYIRDQERYGVDPEQGDKVSYVHVNRPHFDLFGRQIEFDIRTKDWQLRLMRRAKFLRKLLPTWHAREKEFRDWYIREVVHSFGSGSDYEKHVEALELPDEVRGYREIRYPKMESARRRAAELLEET